MVPSVRIALNPIDLVQLGGLEEPKPIPEHAHVLVYTSTAINFLSGFKLSLQTGIGDILSIRSSKIRDQS